MILRELLEHILEEFLESVVRIFRPLDDLGVQILLEVLFADVRVAVIEQLHGLQQRVLAFFVHQEL